MSETPQVEEIKTEAEKTDSAISPDGYVQIPIIGIQIEREVFPWVVAGILCSFVLGWSFLQALPAIWFDEEGYYSHGILVPFMTLAVIYMRREQIRSQPVSSSPWGIPILLVGLSLVLSGRVIDNISLAAFGFILCLIGGVYFAFGNKIGRITLTPLLFLIFMMPFLGFIIDTTTNPLQLISTRIAEKMLLIVGFQVDIPASNPTLIILGSGYDMMVGGPCSGFKLILSLAAFTIFFVMISNLGLWKNLVLFALAIPLALFVNGLRIMLIGVVGNMGMVNPDGWMSMKLREWGGKEDIGMVFHDYSGYLTLIVCFVILHYIVKFLEGKQPNEKPS